MLRTHRLRAGMSQEDLARVSGLSVRGIRMIETQRRRPRASTVRILAEALRLSADEAREVLEAVNPEARAADDAGPPEPPVPRQLPAAPWGFVGREDSLSRVDCDADRDESLLWVVTGSGGVGKTWLAVRWANDNAERFPDGQLYVNLRGFDPATEPVPPLSALRGMVTALGVPSGSVPSDLDELSALYRTITADKRLLVLLDNAHDAAQAAPLLPGGDANTTIVTSRDTLDELVTAHGGRRTRVDSFTETASRRLLADRLGRQRLADEGSSVDSLVTTCGGLPMALSIIAARAARYPDHPLAAIVDELVPTGTDTEDAGEIAASLRVVFDSSRRRLTDETSTMFDLLGLGPGDGVDAWAAASLLGQPVSRARKALRELEDVNLIEQDAPNHYRMHDLTYAYAAERAQRGRNEEALRRVVDHYVGTGYAANWALQPSFDDHDLTMAPRCVPSPMRDRRDALAWYRREARNLLRYQEIALRHGWYDAAWRLADGVEMFSGERVSDLAIDKALWTRALRASEHLRPWHRIRAQRVLAMCLTNISLDDPEAVTLLREAIARATEVGEIAESASAHYSLALAFDYTGRYEEARQHVAHALALVAESGNPRKIANGHNLMCMVLTHLGSHGDAERHGETALNVAIDNGLAFMEGMVRNSLAANALSAGHHAEAVEGFSRAQSIYDALDAHGWSQENLERLGDALRSLGRQREAVKAWMRAADLMQRDFRLNDARRVRAKLTGLDAA